jgi:micrococcal nuclease
MNIFLPIVFALAISDLNQWAPPSTPPTTFRARVNDVHDGDTIMVTVNLGLDVSRKETVRLDGIDAPELSTPAGQDVATYVRILLIKRDVTLVVRPGAEREKYGRLLATVWYGSTNVNQLLIKRGYAKPYDGGKRGP